MKTKIIALLFVVVSSFSFGQKKLADKFFDNFAYVKASELYELAFERGDDSKHVLTRLGDCYWNNSNSEKAAFWYKKALEKHKKIDIEYIHKYIQTQLSLGNYEEVEKWIPIFNEKNTDGSTYKIGNLNTYKELSSLDKVYVTIENLESVNTEHSDFGSYVNNDKFYFASTKNIDNQTKVYKWNDEPYLDIYVANFDGENFSDESLLKGENVNSRFHEATVAITNDGKTMYFTRVNLKNNKRLISDKEGTAHLKLYKATLENDEWTNIEELPFNSELFSTGHPALSPDNKKLYFVSDREGGKGQTDIYVVDINGNSYSSPKNLGDKVNTIGREMFPYVSKDNTLYFSSDGHINLGLLDVYKSNIINNENAETENLGAPINSGFDDFAYFINEDNTKGYFSSNREGGKGNDDIYSFENSECEQTIKGIVLNTETEEPIEGATVQQIDSTGKIIKEHLTSVDGTFEFIAECDDSYTILGKKEDYKDDFKEVVTDKENKKVHNLQLNLEPLIRDDQIVINPIFFDFDKWNIRTDAQYELENIVDVLREHPNMVIKIESHTDSRGSDRYNMKLSDRRAKSTRDYIISRGIDANRVESAIGYGETQLLNKCSNGVKCTEEEHQLNRRSYFYIVKY